MTKRKRSRRLTAAQMNVLQVLWEGDSLTLSEAHDAMVRKGSKLAYTTIQTQLERLVEKGYVSKTGGRPAQYRAAVAPEEVSGPLLDLLLERVTGAVPLFAHLVQDPSLSGEDFAEMKRLIAEAERRHKQGKTSEKKQ